jgi:hypothetical protein
MKEVFLVCAKAGVNAVSTCEEAFYPQKKSKANQATMLKITV